MVDAAMRPASANIRVNAAARNAFVAAAGPRILGMARRAPNVAARDFVLQELPGFVAAVLPRIIGCSSAQQPTDPAPPEACVDGSVTDSQSEAQTEPGFADQSVAVKRESEDRSVIANRRNSETDEIDARVNPDTNS